MNLDVRTHTRDTNPTVKGRDVPGTSHSPTPLCVVLFYLFDFFYVW